MLPILNQMFFLIKIWKKLYKISCDLHTIKTKVTFRSKNYVPEFLWIFFGCPSTMTTFPFSQALTLQKDPVFQQSFASLTACFIPTRFQSSFIIQSHSAPVHLVIHQSRHQTHQYIYIQIPTSYILCPKKVQKNNAKVSKLYCLQPQRLESLYKKYLNELFCNPR